MTVMPRPREGAARSGNGALQICCRDVDKKRDFEIDASVKVTSNPADILEDDEIDMVLELLSGVELAKTVVLSSIRAGKHVVTANKALLASHMAEIEEAMADHPQVGLGYEAAVAGGIPIIRSLQTSFPGDRVTRVAGILNGTTNFMLSSMSATGESFSDELAKAQALGYAEADPTADVDGWDALAKLVILIRLCFGVRLTLADIPPVGIREVTAEDFEYAGLLESTIKLVGSAHVDSALSASLCPFLVPKDSVVGSVHGVNNLVSIVTDNLGELSMQGPGAGRFATANSVVSDAVSIARGRVGLAEAFPVALTTELAVDMDLHSRFYVRLVVRDDKGILRVVGEVAEGHGLSLYSVLQTPIKTRERVAFVVTTDATRWSQVRAFAADIHKQPWSLEEPFSMPFLEP
jgi:homoserine dehydrogenase